MTGQSPLDRLSAVARRITPAFVRRRYAVKFLISILVVVVVVSAIGSVGFLQAQAAVEDDTTSQLKETSDLQANSLAAWVSSIRTQTRSVSAGEALRSGVDEGESPSGYLRSEWDRLSADILAIHYVDTEGGTVAASTVVPLEGTSTADIDAPWTDATVPSGPGQNDAVWLSDSAYLSPVHSDQSVLAFASSVPDRPDRMVVVVARIQPQIERLEGAQTERRTRIVDGDGRSVLQPNGSTEGAGHVDAVTAARQTDQVQFREGGKRLYAYAQVEGTDWVALTSVDKADAFAVRDAVGANVLLIVFGALLSLALVGAVLGHQTISPLQRLRDRAERMENGDLDVDFTTHRVDEIGRLFDGFASMRDSLGEQISAAEGARQEAEAARRDAEQMNQRLERKADEYREVMQACAEGDLTRRLDPDAESDAMRAIAGEFNRMLDRIEETMASLKTFAADVAAASEEVTASTEEVSGASEEVSGSVQEISDGAERQNESLQTVAEEMNSLSATVEEIASSAQDVAEVAERTAETGQEARSGAEGAAEGMDAVQRETDRMVEAMDGLQGRMDEIEEVTSFITEVAEQTNILALNANIEAARAGEAGEGFAVVADEVKGLAEETRDAAEEIETLVGDIQAQTETTAEEVQRTSEEVSRSSEAVERTVDALDEIAGYAEETNTGVQEISDATSEQAGSTNQVVETVDEVASISQETSQQSENVAAAAEEQTSALAEVTESAQTLADQASQLSRGLESFQTEAEGDLSFDAGSVGEASPDAADTDTAEPDAADTDADPGPAGGGETPAGED